jgi:septal ring factor EnvC (AmiA/AmiB activator)
LSERQKTRSEELLALADTIKLLNDDDALELFKKAVPNQGGASFVQVNGRSTAQMRARALAAVHEARRKGTHRAAGIDLIALALHSKTAGFEQVQAMIDDMIKVLGAEQDDDDKKVQYCNTELDNADDKKKKLERTLSDEEAAVSNANDGIALLADELKALAASIQELDKNVQEATEQRKQENTDYTELMALA